jgi:hypothetical protein
MKDSFCRRIKKKHGEKPSPLRERGWVQKIKITKNNNGKTK